MVVAVGGAIFFSFSSSGTTVPTFDEVLAFARGKIGVYVDTKRASAAHIVAALDGHDMQDHVVVYGGFAYLAQVAALRPRIKVMPESVNATVVKKLIAELKPQVIAFDARDFTDEIIGLARVAKAGIYVDRLGDADRPELWHNAVDRGATGIQTDHPAELLRFLRSKTYTDKDAETNRCYRRSPSRMPTPLPCQEKESLIQLSERAKELYVRAAQEVGNHSCGGFELAYKEAGLARHAYDAAKAALDAHVEQHGC
jgi:glycerophosphoryl diester phosphodiesterase